MRRKSDQFEWEFREENDEWPPLSAANATVDGQVTAAGSAKQQWTRRWLWLVASVFLLSSAGATVYLQRVAAQGLKQIETELQETVHREEWTAQNAPLTAMDTIVDEQIHGDWQQVLRREALQLRAVGGDDAPLPVTAVEEVNFYGDLAAVQIVLAWPGVDGDAITYRQLRFYRPDGQQWLRTIPDTGYWGVQETLVTEHFVFRFRHRDGAAVKDVAAGIDQLYSTLRSDYGLPPSHEILEIEVDATAKLRSGLLSYFQGNRLRIASPALLLMPSDLSQEQILTLWIAGPLVGHVLGEAEARLQPKAPWIPVLGAVSQWQIRSQSPQLASWHNALTGWLYGPVLGETDHSRLSHLDSFDRLCAQHHIRQRLPILMGANTTGLCIFEGEAKAYTFLVKRPPPPIHIGELMASYQASPYVHWNWVQFNALESVLDYAISTYGRARLPDLVAGLRTYRSWQELVPAVYGVTLDEFEEGWQHYLVAQTEL